MLTFAAWHWWAVASVVFAGLFSFMLKVGAERTHSSSYLNGVASFVSFALSFAGALLFDESLTPFVVVLAAINGFMYIFGTLARSDALAYIDSTLFFPLYKIIGPIIVLASGVLFLGEELSGIQWIGFVLVVGVPLLLIDRMERARQKDLSRGVWLVLVAAAMVSGGTIFSKIAMDAGAGPMSFSVIAYGMTVLGIATPYLFKHRRDATSKAHWKEIVWMGIISGIFQFLGFIALLFAYQSGPVGVAYAINSTYILIPIVLSIWYYGEHWNARKVIAIGLSVLAVILLR